MNTGTTNHHCTCIKINSTGVLIEGVSGAGKTSLALGLLEAARSRGAEAKLVCDDQAILFVKNEELWARVPETIAGKIELYGFGVVDADFIKQARIDLVCKLVVQEKIVRLPETSVHEIMGVRIDYIEAPTQHEALGIRLLLNKLSLPL
ncbi:MAG: HPr kinase/phosphatase C-terminal domain-containing protein [Rhizobiaceae bacterium]|nr:HPr kinase/phosphatase C-terminal domain-containing protein [Rhizobiaceae bacterium]